MVRHRFVDPVMPPPPAYAAFLGWPMSDASSPNSAPCRAASKNAFVPVRPSRRALHCGGERNRWPVGDVDGARWNHSFRQPRALHRRAALRPDSLAGRRRRWKPEFLRCI